MRALCFYLCTNITFVQHLWSTSTALMHIILDALFSPLLAYVARIVLRGRCLSVGEHIQGSTPALASTGSTYYTHPKVLINHSAVCNNFQAYKAFSALKMRLTQTVSTTQMLKTCGAGSVASLAMDGVAPELSQDDSLRK